MAALPRKLPVISAQTSHNLPNAQATSHSAGPDLSNLVIVGFVALAVVNVALATVSGSIPSVGASRALSGDIVLPALVVIVAALANTRGLSPRESKAAVIAATVYFFGLVVAAATADAIANYTADEIVLLVLGTFFGNGALCVVLIVLTLQPYAMAARTPAVAVSGLIAVACTSPVYQSVSADVAGSLAGFAAVLVAVGGWPFLTAAGLILVTRPSLLLSRLVRNSAIVAFLASAIGLLFTWSVDADSSPFRDEFFSALSRATFARTMAVLVITFLLASYAIARGPNSTERATGSVAVPLGVTTALLILFWPTAIVALNHLAQAQAALVAGDTSLARDKKQAARFWLAVTAAIAVALWSFVVLTLRAQ